MSNYVLGNENYEIAFDLESGIQLTRLYNRQTGDEYLKDRRYAYFGNPFCIKLLGDNGCYRFLNSGQDFRVTRADQSADGETLHISAEGADLAVSLAITAPQEEVVSYWSLTVQNTGSEPLTGEVCFPLIVGLTVGDSLTRQTACAPMYMGGIRRNFADYPHPLWYPYALVEDGQPTYASPYSMPWLDLLSSTEDSGLFVVVLDPEARRKSLALTTVGQPQTGMTEVVHRLQLQPGEPLSLPQIAIGIHTGDWHVAADYYRQAVGEQFDPVAVPSWFREAAALYGVGGVGGGGGFLAIDPFAQGGYLPRFGGSLDTEIASFDELPSILERARQMGTSIIYLWDYWEGEHATGMPPYWNKGDYVPRADLGGADAFKRGIAAVHQEGGRVLVYVEGFIVYKNSQPGMTDGRAMALMDEQGAYYEDYRNYWSMCPADEAWRARLTEICVRLVRDFDVDGIFLDSYGANWSHLCFNPNHSHAPETDIWNKGLPSIVAEVRNAIRQIKPDAVVMTESVNDLLLPVVDGACDGSLIWLGGLHEQKLLGSPLKYTFPAANIFSNGSNLAQLNQVFAFGGNLAVGPAWQEHADYIRTLTRIKRAHKSAYIYGHMLPPISTNSRQVVAAIFQGGSDIVLHAVNLGDDLAAVDVNIPAKFESEYWYALLTNSRTRRQYEGGLAWLTLSLQPGELQIWIPSDTHTTIG